MSRTATYEKIIVPSSSQLIFANAPINLNVKNIFVQGKLNAGSPRCRINAPIKITFLGAKTTNNDIAAGYGSKGIGVSGSIDLHGKQFNPVRSLATLQTEDY